MAQKKEMITRTANISDIDSILKLDELAVKDTKRLNHIEDAIASGKCTVACIANQVVGYITYDQSFFMHHFLTFIVISSEHRRRGIAKTLLKDLECRCPGKLFTSCNVSNIPASKLFLNVGFIPSGIVTNLDQNDPELIYFKHQ